MNAARVPAKLTFSLDTTHTAGVEIRRARFLALKSPIAAAITFEGSFDGVTYFPIKDGAGAAIGFTTVVGALQPIPSHDLVIAPRWLRIVTPVQAADITFEFAMKTDEDEV
jgi:hypothetical protein